MGETDVQIVGMSADDQAMEVFKSAGVDVFVPKPLNIEAIGSFIQEVINKKKNTMV